MHSVATEDNGYEPDAVYFIRSHWRLWCCHINSIGTREQREPVECGSDRAVNYRPVHDRYRINGAQGADLIPGRITPGAMLPRQANEFTPTVQG